LYFCEVVHIIYRDPKPLKSPPRSIYSIKNA